MSRQIVVLAVGRIKRDDPHAELIAHYTKQIPSAVQIVELDTADYARENAAIRDAMGKHPGTHWMALDVRGESVSSEKLAQIMEPHSRLGFIIGGADGLDDTTRGLCTSLIAFGKMIWPHKLARTMLIEQVFRAHHIWTNHPYHRA